MVVSYAISDGLTVGLEHLWPLVGLPIGVAALWYLVLRGPIGNRSASPRSRRLLFASRVLLVCLLVLGAMGPYTVQTRETPGEPHVTLLTDDSASMAVYPNTTDALAADIEAQGVPVTTVTVGSGTRSRLGDALVANLQENGTVVVHSDGQVTAGRTLPIAGERARTLNATIHTIDLAAEETERAVSISGPATVSRGIPVEYTVRIRGVQLGAPVPVELVVDGETVATETLAVGESFTTSYRFNATGPHRVDARVGAGDVHALNDAYHRSVRVVEKPRLLYVSGGGYPLEEYLEGLYNVTNVSRVPSNLDPYAAVVLQDTPADAIGDVGALQDHVIGGGGLVVVGGPNAYEAGGYNRSSIATMLPVRVGNASGGTTDIVLLVDISGSAGSGLSIQKAVALDVLAQLDDRNRVGVVAFNQLAYRIADLRPLEDNREAVADRIRRLESGGETRIAVGLQGADQLLGDRPGTIILFSDGQDEPGPPAVVADRLQRDGTRVITVGAGREVNEAVLRQIAEAGGGAYFRADETNRLRLLFGGGTRRFQGEELTIISRGTFITAGVELTADPPRANRVTIRPGADFQVATADGTPAIASWRFGLGRVVSITAFGEDGTLDGLLERPDSLVVTRSVNYAVGDPARTLTGVTSVQDARAGASTTLVYRGDDRPSHDAVTFQRIGPDRYRGEFTAGDVGYHEILGTEYAVNYRREYAAYGQSPALIRAVHATDGRTYEPSSGAAIAREAREEAVRVRSVRDGWSWLALLLAVVLFAGEVLARRVQVYRGRTPLESGLP